MSAYTVERSCVECSAGFVGTTSQVTCSDPCRRARRRRQTTRAQTRWRARSTRAASRDVAQALSERLSGGRSSMPLTIAQLVELQLAMRHKQRGDGTAERLAELYGLHVRAVHRYASLGPPRPVHVGQWMAWYAPRREGAPVQLTEWVGSGGH